MTPPTQTHASDINTQHPQHQSQVSGNPAHQGNSGHTLTASVGSAAYTTDNHLAGLVEAATAAAGQNMAWAQPEEGENLISGEARSLQNQFENYGVSMQLDDGFGNQGSASGHPFIISTNGGQGSTKMGRQIGHATDALQPTNGNNSARKRKRGNPNLDPSITTGSTFMSSGSGNSEHEPIHEVGLNIRSLPPQNAISNARAAGVHSAVALFRQPSATSKKYTRPPMSKLFSSLELSPENFLHLQAAAKAYMLDDNHPERRDCVGQRGKGDTEMVRLRLWNCVSEFLDKEGNGPRFFGENVINEGMPPRQMVWPRDDQKIISLMMPLLRRMVTNERQRQYAIETRKGGVTDEKKQKRGSSATPKALTPEDGMQFQGLPTSEIGMLDLLSGGYPSDWDSITQSYTAYNHDYCLDNLGAISGLSHSDWLGLVAAVDCHYQVDHHGNGFECDQPCQDCMVNHIVTSDSASHANWRIGGQGDDLAARTYFASGITRDVSHIIRQNLMDRANDQHHSSVPTAPLPAPTTEPFTQQTSNLTAGSATHHTIHRSKREEGRVSGSVRVLVNVVYQGDDKRLLPRYELEEDQSAALSTLLKSVRQYQHHQSPQAPTLPGTPRVRAWLKHGLTPIKTDDDWMAALMAAHTVDWMDGELRVVIDGGGVA